VPPHYLIGVDVGTTSVKGIILEPGRGIVGEASRAGELLSRYPGWAEMDPGAWWTNTVEVIRELLASGLAEPSQIAAIGVSGMVPALVLLDAGGRVLRPSIQQNDARTGAQLDQLHQLLDAGEVFRRTGGSINQQLLAPKLMWLREHEPAVLQQARWVLGSYDYINYRLTGDLGVEANWALESGLYDINAARWIEEYVGLGGIGLANLPAVRQPAELAGRVSVSAAEQTGLPVGTPVVAGCADHVASAFAAGLVEPGDLNIKFGGAGDILFCLDRLDTDPRLFIDYHLLPGSYLINGCMAASGSLVKWFLQELVGSVVPGQDGHSRASLLEMDRAAAELPPGAEGLVVLPYFLGEKTPLHDPAARGAIFGLTLHHGRAHVFRAILEAVVFGFRHHLDVLRERGHEPRRVVATDGGARSPLWRQIAADIIGLPVEYQADHPGSALGSAFAAGIGAGVLDDWRVIREYTRVSATAQPNPRHTAAYDQLYGIYRDLYPASRPLAHRLAGMTGAEGGGI